MRLKPMGGGGGGERDDDDTKGGKQVIQGLQGMERRAGGGWGVGVRAKRRDGWRRRQVQTDR